MLNVLVADVDKAWRQVEARVAVGKPVRVLAAGKC
jgi:hypothetical protein